jgi:hypothetical protein
VLGFLLILAVVLVVADRAAAAVAAGQLKSRVASELAARQVSYSSLDVTINGTPFLTQVAQSRYEAIRIDVTDAHLRSGEIALTLPVLVVVATGVHADALDLARGQASVTAEAVTGSGVVSYTGLGSLVDLSAYYIHDLVFSERAGALYANATLVVAGLEIPIEVGAEVSLLGGQIQVAFRDVAASGLSVPEFALSAVDALVNQVIVAAMPPLPFDITLDALQVTPHGLAITATGRDVILARG